MTDLVVLDASAILAWRDEEPGAHEVVDPVLDGALLCAVNGAEVRYKSADSGDDPQALIDDLIALGVEIVPFTDDEARHFPSLRDIDRRAREVEKGSAGTSTKGRGGRPRRRSRLSLADLACLSLALEREARVITGDGHWVTLVEHGLDVSVTDYHSR